MPEEASSDLWLAAFGGSCGAESWLRTKVEFVEVVAVGVAACFADFAVLAEGEGEEDWVAFACYADAWADFANVARAYMLLVSSAFHTLRFRKSVLTFMS